MESLLCNEVWPMSPSADLNVQDNDGCSKERNSFSTSFHSTEKDCQEAFGFFLDKGAKHMPEAGHLKLLQTNDLIKNSRFKVVNWIIKSQKRLNLSLGTVSIAVNYLDRFLSLTQCQGWRYWMLELLSIACLSVASKFNETTTRPLREFQVEGLGHSFAPSLIQRMELTLLKGLGWRMGSTTPFSYIDFLMHRIDASNKTLVEDLAKRATDLLICALLDLKFMEYQPHVVATAAVRCVAGGSFPSTDNDASLFRCLEAVIPQDQKDDLIKCQRRMGKLLALDYNVLACGHSWDDLSSPDTVLKEEWFDFCDCPVGLCLPNIDLKSSTKRRSGTWAVN